MVSKLLFIPFITIGLCSFSGKNDNSPAIDSKSWGKVQEGMWVQKTEVSNAEFKLFLNDLKENGRLEEWHKFYPDTSGWAKGDKANQPYVEYYFSNPAYNNYPVVNITWEAAKAYCDWLTGQYSKQKKQPFGKVVFRLPSHDEWMKAASSAKEDGRTYPWNGLYLHNSRGERLCNFREDHDSLNVKDAGSKKQGKGISASGEISLITSQVKSFFPNDIGLYNVCGNVAEMLAEKGLAAGGSYQDTGYFVRIQIVKQYSGAASDIGFRVLMQKTGS